MKLIYDNKPKQMKFSGSVSDLLKKLGLMREEVLVKVNGKLVPDTRTIESKDTVEVIKVIFGG